MPSVTFSTNPADWVALEGVYISEQNPPSAVVGVNLNRVIVAGQTVRGPDGPVEITSFARFLEVYGGRDLGAGGSLVNEVWEFLQAKRWGYPLVVVRARAAAAVKASFTLETAAGGGGTEVLRVDASSVGSWAGSAAGGSTTGVKIKVEAATDGNVNHFNLRVKYLGQTRLYENLDISSTNDNTASVLGDDEGNWITLTKLAAGVPVTAAMSGLDSDGYITLGQTVASFTSVAGADDTIADSDYTATGGPIDVLANYPGMACACIAKRANATLNAALKAKAAAATDRIFPIWNGTLGASTSTVISDVSSYRSDRIVYCYNAPYITDPETAQAIQVPPHSWLASIISQTFVDVHVGSEQTKALNAGIRKLTQQGLSRADYVSLKAAGICSLERDEDGNFAFVSGVTTDLTVGKTEIARRRQTDFIQLSLAKASRPIIKEPNTPDNRAMIAALYTDFLGGWQRAGRIVESFSLDQDSVNTTAQRSRGLEMIQVNVDLIEHILSFVVKTRIGYGVETADVAA